ncbi:MAG: BatA domain-containing protein, partial [Gemmatimonadaceae bacterium]|nr:BatA domain-containing protein [Gemmatimonadaceae bacterium]
MSWGNPLAALLALGILVPLVLHLWHRHTTEHQSFPALAWVRRAEREHGRALRTRNLTLMLLRIGAIAALALAAARPAARLLGVRSTPRTLVLLIDNTMSSGAVDGGATVLDAARRAALALLDEAHDAERAWVVTADGAVLGGTVDAY